MNSASRHRRQLQAPIENEVRLLAKDQGLKLIQCGVRNGEEPTYNLNKGKKHVHVALTIVEARAELWGSVTDTPQPEQPEQQPESEQPEEPDTPALRGIAAAINSTVDSLIKGEPDTPEQPEGQRGVVATIDKLEEIESEIVDGEIVDDHMDVKAARALTDDIRRDMDVVWGKVVQAYHGRADIALGYTSWDEYCVKEFGTTRLRIPSEERAELVTSLRAAGLSYRALESATGISKSTASRIAKESTVPPGTVDSKVTGLDQKQRDAQRKVADPAPQRRPDNRTRADMHRQHNEEQRRASESTDADAGELKVLPKPKPERTPAATEQRKNLDSIAKRVDDIAVDVGHEFDVGWQLTPEDASNILYGFGQTIDLISNRLHLWLEPKAAPKLRCDGNIFWRVLRFEVDDKKVVARWKAHRKRYPDDTTAFVALLYPEEPHEKG
jgi:hypothetical protein